VRLQALDVLTRKADEAAREPMLELLTDEESPLRLRASVADALQRLGWSVKGFRKRVEDNLPEGLGVDRSGKIKGRWVNAPSEAE
jgi:HEAT repeat protein